ncbi:MAG: hypothetical protein ACPGWR_15755, partial [Ardenticatenaceae bacterium]
PQQASSLFYQKIESLNIESYSHDLWDRLIITTKFMKGRKMVSVLTAPTHPSLAPSADELVGALDMLGLHVLSGGIKPHRVIPPAELVAGLVMQSDARIRLALVGLLLYRPDFALAVPLATSSLCVPNSAPCGSQAYRGHDLLTLKLYYTAAMLLQKKYDAQLTQLLGEREQLPDLFSEELAVSATGSVDTRLKELGEQHKALVATGVNWVGTYHHGAKRLIKRLKCEVKWGLR